MQVVYAPSSLSRTKHEQRTISTGSRRRSFRACLSMQNNMHIAYIYIYIYTYIYIHVYICVYTYIYMYIYVYFFYYIYIYVYIRARRSPGRSIRSAVTLGTPPPNPEIEFWWELNFGGKPAKIQPEPPNPAKIQP